jgi:hypothetical protein
MDVGASTFVPGESRPREDDDEDEEENEGNAGIGIGVAIGIDLGRPSVRESALRLPRDVSRIRPKAGA